ncbi:hypothetical protein L5515_015446 [Caenorhabditis briggsae]|uniref:C2H2-type domain-containing protein n=1 Tax=Caenorhabditis briggsae TaxID=6238 RepID=A0AAE9J860_CAEBR|nr:hypothetical protein L5515_015446 [Caenorhabditis briggsae]
MTKAELINFLQASTTPNVVEKTRQANGKYFKVNETEFEQDAEKLVMEERKKFSETKNIGVYAMAVKITRLDFPIGAPINLPQYILDSTSIISLQNVDNNMCFWYCIAVAVADEECRKDRASRKAKQLFKNFYGAEKRVTNYVGFDYVNELDKYEKFNEKYAINIVSYYEDGTISYVRKSSYNASRKPIYLNLYLNHFSYITDLSKLFSIFMCQRCGSKFRDNFNLDRHRETCTLTQEDTFDKYPTLWKKDRNLIVELADIYDVEVDFKYDFMITFDMESRMQKMNDKVSDKLTYTMKHIPTSVAIATNVPGFEDDKFILNEDPNELVKEMFKWFDDVASKASQLIHKAMLRFEKDHPMIWLFGEENKNAFYKLKKNITGGASIVFHRYHEVNKTEITRAHYNGTEWTYPEKEEYNGVYEVTKRSKKVKQNMALQIACSVYDDSKLNMLKFYYDCVDKYVDRSDFQYIEMDTDSAYMAITGNTLEDLIKPELKEEFERDKSLCGYGSTQPNQRKRGAENQTRGQGRKRQLIQSTHSFDRVQKTHEAHKIYHHHNLFKPRKDPVLDSNNPVFEDWPVPHGVELPPGSAPGIKMPVRAPTPIKQVILDETDHSGSVVVERRDRSEEREKEAEEVVQGNVVPHSTVVAVPQEPHQQDGTEMEGGESEGEEEQEGADAQNWQRMLQSSQGQYPFAPQLPPLFPQQPIHPQMPFPHWPQYPIIPQHQQILANRIPHFSGATPHASNFPPNGPQFGGFVGFPGSGTHFGNLNIPGSASTPQASSSMKMPKRPTPKRKTKTKGDLEKELAELKQSSDQKLAVAQAEITKLRSGLFNNANALQNENIQKDALILQLQEKVRQSEEVIKKAVEEKNEAEEWKGVLATSLTKTTEALKKMTTEKVEENKEMDQLRGELDAEKKKTEAALTLLREERKQRAAEEKKNLENQNAWRTQMKNFNEDKDRNEKELKEALLMFQEKNIEQVREIEDFKKAKQMFENEIKQLKEEKKTFELEREAEKKKHMDSYDRMNEEWQTKTTGLDEKQRKKLEEITSEYQSVLEEQKKENEDIKKERDEHKKNKVRLKAAKKKMEEEKRILEVTVMDQVNENKNLEMDRDAEKRNNKDLMDAHSKKLEDLVREHQTVLEDQEKKKVGLENERDELKKLNVKVEVEKKKLEEEKDKLEGKVRDHENEKKKKLEMELEKLSAELAEKNARRLQLVAEIQKQNEKEESEDTNTSNKPGSQEEDQKEDPQEDGEKGAPSTSTKLNKRTWRRRGELREVTEPPVRRKQAKVDYR